MPAPIGRVPVVRWPRSGGAAAAFRRCGGCVPTARWSDDGAPPRSAPAVAGADVTVNGERVGTTDADGTVEVTVPDADEFEVEASFEAKGKLTVPLAEGEAANEDAEDDAADDELEVAVDGNVSAGETVVVAVTQDGAPVENATVTLDDEVVGITDEDGKVAVTIPSDAAEIEFEVEAGDAEGEYEAEFEASAEESDG